MTKTKVLNLFSSQYYCRVLTTFLHLNQYFMHLVVPNKLICDSALFWEFTTGSVTSSNFLGVLVFQQAQQRIFTIFYSGQLKTLLSWFMVICLFLHELIFTVLRIWGSQFGILNWYTSFKIAPDTGLTRRLFLKFVSNYKNIIIQQRICLTIKKLFFLIRQIKSFINNYSFIITHLHCNFSDK